MIYYYSATGNTRFAADYLANKLDTFAINILDLKEPPVTEEDIVGFMFPIYCWGIPPVFRKFLERLIPGLSRESYVWGLCTCGDETGTAMKQFDKMLKSGRGRGADALWSLIMPNTYVLLPGFDVDSPDEEKKKLYLAPERIDEIASLIRSREKGIYDVCQGSFPALRSSIFPLFEKWGVSAKRWHAASNCIGCGKCANVCPARNITMSQERPAWGNNCFSCCACFHCCPVNAVAYGSFTKGKSQYKGPHF